MNFRIRKARAADIPRLREIIDASVRGLQAEDYSPAQIEGALTSVYGVDSQFAPTEVPDRRSCLPMTLASSQRGSARHKRMTRSANCFVRSLRSLISPMHYNISVKSGAKL
jgi:hypothetical protein